MRITIFGSARFSSQNLHYQKAYKISKLLAQNDFEIATGGGGGIMEAANKGAFEVGGKSIGINIKLPFEQKENPYCTEHKMFSNLSKRRNELIKNSQIFIVMPGGFGTLDELFEVLTLVQTGLKNHKIILVDSDFWSPLIDFFHSRLLKFGAISQENFSFFEICDEAQVILEKCKIYRENLSKF